MKKIVVISGASRGIGKECATKFAEEGYSLSLCCIENLNLLEDLKKDLEKKGAEVLIQKCDVSKKDEVDDWIKNTVERFGRIDVLVSNAGIALYSLLVNTSEYQWSRIMDVNLKGAFLLSRAVYDTMVSQKYGSIVFVSSIWGKIGGAMESAYASSKAGIIALAKSLAKELGPSNIRVNAIAPGAVNTEMLSPISKEDLDNYAESTPLGRIADPREVAELIYFIASEKASFISSAVISIDGGNS